MKNIICFLIVSLSVGCSFGTSISKNSSGSIIPPLKFEKNEKGILKINPTQETNKSKPKKNDTVTPSTKEISELPALPLLGSVEQGGRKENIARIDSFLQKEINNKTEHQIILEQKPAPSKENVVSVFTPKQNKAIQENAPNKESSVKIHWAKLILFYLSVFSLIYICFLSWKHRKKIYSLLKNKKKTYSLLTKRASR